MVILPYAKVQQHLALMISRTFLGSLGEKVALIAKPLTMISKYGLFFYKSVFK
jgi:hypothetical protein